MSCSPHRLPACIFSFLPAGPFPSLLALHGRISAHLCNEDLALTPDEVFELCNDILHVPVDGLSARRLYGHTEGWMMGLILSAHYLAIRGEHACLLPSSQRDRIFGYFQEEIFSIIPKDLREPLLRLSLLEDIPADLAGALTEKPDIRKRLNDLATKNFFLRILGEKASIFRFHNLFQEVLRNEAERELAAEAISTVFRTAAEFYLQRDDVESGLFYLIRLQDYPAVDRLLGKSGLRFVALNQVLTLNALLGGLPEETAAVYPWIAYFRGVILMDAQPHRALPFFERAGELFATQGDAKGELLTIAQCILFHGSIDCRFHVGPQLLQRADILFPLTQDLLDDRSLIFVTMYLSNGFCLMRVEPEKARFYAELALNLTRKGTLKNLEAFARFNMGILNAFFGNQRQMLRELEQAWPLLHNPQVGTMHRLHLRILQLNALALTGDFVNFFVQEEEFRRETAGDLVIETIAGPILLVNKIDAALDEDRLDLALERIERGLSWGGPADSPHLRSQFLHYKAFVCALLGRTEESRAAACESNRLRDQAGGELWQVVNDMIVGGALAHAGCEEEAEDFLSRAIENARSFGEEFLRAGAYAHRAALHLWRGRHEEVLADLRDSLACMRENGYLTFFTWTRREMLPLLQEAVKGGIDTGYARFLAAERLGMAIRGNGTALPLLEIRAFGELSLSVDTGKKVAARDLTPAQRELLGLLLCSPKAELGQEEIQSLLWPESPAAKARSKFDNLLSRLRRVVDERLGVDSARDYLVMEKGLLRFTHCRIDARMFMEKARQGLRHVKAQEFWQAGNTFHLAHRLWRGNFLPGVKESDRLRDCRHDLHELYFESSLVWGQLLGDSGRLGEAAGVLEKAWALDRSHHDLAQALYRIHQDRKDVRKTRQVQRQYEDALLDLECPPEEVREILLGLTA